MDSPADPMTSRQKIVALLAQLDTIEPQGVEPQLQMALAMATMARPQIMGALPEDPDQLDELLLIGAHWFLKLRSDHADGFAVLPIEAGEPIAIAPAETTA